MAHDPKGLLRYNGPTEQLADPATGKLQTHLQKKGDLFPHPPTTADVAQGYIGDCFLLAAIIAILERPGGPELIEGMMRDNGDQTVTIRLHRNRRPHYLRMNKSLIYEFFSTRVLHGQGALWVAIIEKAYAAFACDESSYASLDKGGHSSEALAVLLGGMAGEIGPSRSLFVSVADSEVWNNLINHAHPNIILRDPVKMAEYREGFEIIFGDSADLLERWKGWYTPQRKMALFRCADLDTLEGFLNSALPHADLRRILVDWARIHQALPGGSSFGRYNSLQIDKYRKIQRLLAMRVPLAAGTRAYLGRSNRLGHSANESIAGGLATKHAYGILDTRCDRTTLYIKLRNPWGRVGREYIQQGGATIIQETANGEFFLELWDFDRSFDKIYQGGEALTVAQQDFRRNLAQNLEEQKAQLRPVANRA